jgi:hypothetical protein
MVKLLELTVFVGNVAADAHEKSDKHRYDRGEDTPRFGYYAGAGFSFAVPMSG